MPLVFELQVLGVNVFFEAKVKALKILNIIITKYWILGDRSQQNSIRYLVMESHHGVVENNRDTVIQEGLAEDKEVEAHVDTDLLENGQNGNLG